MNHRERVLETFAFRQTDCVACDLMEGFVWPELLEYFSAQYGHAEATQVQDLARNSDRKILA